MRFGLLFSGTLLSGMLLSCNRYEFFNVAGYEQASFSNDADILFVIDNSASMWQEGAALGQNFNAFISQLTSQSGGSDPVSGLGDAVDDYVSYVTKRGDFIDYQLAITTTTVDYTGAGATDALEPGEAGLLIGEPIGRKESDVETAFKKDLLCNTVYWDSQELLAPENQDPTYDCAAGADPEFVSVQYLDCLCGTGQWESPAGSGQEEPLEAALLALCRAEENPPDVCYEVSEGTSSVFGTNDVGTNDGFLRDGSTVVIVILGDEGDTSRRIANGSANVEPYLEAFAAFERNIKVVALGPDLVPDSDGLGYSMPCNNGGATDWAALRLMNMTAETNGFYRSLEEESSNGCELSDFAVHLEKLGVLLNNLDTSFRLATIPDVTSIQVYVDGKTINPSVVLSTTPEGLPLTYDKGWSYESADNAVAFWGDPILNPNKLDEGCCVPDYQSDVRIYYRPLSGKPRELPFSVSASQDTGN